MTSFSDSLNSALSRNASAPEIGPNGPIIRLGKGGVCSLFPVQANDPYGAIDESVNRFIIANQATLSSGQVMLLNAAATCEKRELKKANVRPASIDAAEVLLRKIVNKAADFEEGCGAVHSSLREQLARLVAPPEQGAIA